MCLVLCVSAFAIQIDARLCLYVVRVCLHSTCIFTKPFFAFLSFFSSHTMALSIVYYWSENFSSFYANTSSIIVVVVGWFGCCLLSLLLLWLSRFLLFSSSLLFFVEKYFVTLLRQHDVFIWLSLHIVNIGRYLSLLSFFLALFILNQEWGNWQQQHPQPRATKSPWKYHWAFNANNSR